WQRVPGQDSRLVRSFLIFGFTAEAALFVMFYYLWYAKAQLGGFHFFDDSMGWQGIDKCGLFLFSFHACFTFGFWLRISGVPRAKASGTAFLLGFMVMFPIEVWDGFSNAWGFSLTDILANTTGCLLAAYFIKGDGRPAFLP